MSLIKSIFFINRYTFHPRYLLNRFVQNMEYLQGKTVCKSKPSFITLELTNICNLNCIMCPRAKMKRKTGNMQFSLFKNIIDQVKDFVEVVDLDLYGEFSFNPQWKEMIQYARSAGIFTVLNTNATLMDETLVSNLMDSGLDFLNISFDGASKEVYEKVRQGANYEKTLSHIHNFLEKNKNIHTIIQMIKTTETEAETEKFRRIWSNSGADAVRIKEYMAFDPDKEELDPCKEKKIKMKASPCLFLWKNLVVCWDGIVVPCCVDFDKINVLGDACEEKILDIWNGKPMQFLRKKHAGGEFRDVKLCRKCSPITAHPLVILASPLVDDSMRRKLMPYLEK